MAYFEFLKKNWEIPRNPIVGVSPCTNTPTDQDAISEKDVRKVLRYLEENKFGINRLTRLRNSLIIHILALVWCRPSELLNTNLDSFEKNRTSLRIRNGKWVGKTRAFSLDYKTQELVRGYIQEAAFCGRSKELEKHFFLWTKKWQGLSYNGFRIMCNKLSEKMGMRIYSYMFRRYAISFLYESNVPLQNIQHLAGHTRQSTTLRYIQATPEMNDKAIALLANSING